jgi:hypothetical protein
MCIMVSPSAQDRALELIETCPNRLTCDRKAKTILITNRLDVEIMHRDHPVLTPPDEENAKIWRYMDFTKFYSLIDKSALYFAQVDSLEDKFEGSLPKTFYYSNSMAEKTFSNKLHSEEYNRSAKELKEAIGQIDRKNLELSQTKKKWTFVNCWHLNDYESAAMWKLHLKSEEGVAIQSTYRRLVDCFNKEDDEIEVYIGTVNYIDYEKEQIPLQNALYPFIYKRKSFEHEKELRAIIFGPKRLRPIPTPKGAIYIEEHCELPHGLLIPVNLETLIENVYVAPTAPYWFEDLAKSVLKKYGINKAIIKSSLDDYPMF